VSVPKTVSGWRDKLSRSDSMKKEEPASPAYHGKKRSSITKARVLTTGRLSPPFAPLLSFSVHANFILVDPFSELGTDNPNFDQQTTPTITIRHPTGNTRRAAYKNSER